MKSVFWYGGTDPYDWEKGRLHNYKTNTNASHYTTYCKNAEKELASPDHSWAWILIVELDFTLEGVVTTKQMFYKGKKKEYIELNKEAKPSKKNTPKRNTVEPLFDAPPLEFVLNNQYYD